MIKLPSHQGVHQISKIITDLDHSDDNTAVEVEQEKRIHHHHRHNVNSKLRKPSSGNIARSRSADKDHNRGGINYFKQLVVKLT